MEYTIDPVAGSPSRKKVVKGNICMHFEDLIFKGTKRFLDAFAQSLRKTFQLGSLNTNNVMFCRQDHQIGIHSCCSQVLVSRIFMRLSFQKYARPRGPRSTPPFWRSLVQANFGMFLMQCVARPAHTAGEETRELIVTGQPKDRPKTKASLPPNRSWARQQTHAFANLKTLAALQLLAQRELCVENCFGALVGAASVSGCHSACASASFALQKVELWHPDSRKKQNNGLRTTPPTSRNLCSQTRGIGALPQKVGRAALLIGF